MGAEEVYWDRILACVLAVLVFAGGMMFRENSHFWGDDYAAYMLEGKAIAEGRIDQQTKDNLMFRTTIISGKDTQSLTRLVYVWGFPLQTALMYKLAGFDALTTDMRLYKTPGCLALGILAAILFLFYRRRFNRNVSMVLSSFMVVSIFTFINYIGTDLPFLCMTYCSFLLYEMLWDRTTPKGMAIHACMLGVALWYTHLLRLNGITVILLIAAMHFVKMISCPEYRGRIPYHCLAYVVYAGLLGAFYLCFPYPTSNSGDINMGSLTEGLSFSHLMLSNWIYDMFPFGSHELQRIITLGIRMACLIGILWKGRKEELGYLLFLVATLLGVASLPYNQGLRYYFGFLPLIVMFTGYGFCWLWGAISKYLKQEQVSRRGTALATAAVVLFSTLELGTAGLQLWKEKQQLAADRQNAALNAYADTCLELYRFIREETEEDALIASPKPRALQLNTGRLGFHLDERVYALTEADYYLEMTFREAEMLTAEEKHMLRLIFDNEDFRLYRVEKQNPS